MTADQLRRQRNRDLMAWIKGGPTTSAMVDALMTFFPPRPVIKKDRAEMRRVYGEVKP